MKTTISFTLFLILVAPASWAAVYKTETFEQEFPIAADGVLVVENPFGNVEVTGVDNLQSVSWSAQKLTSGVDGAARDEARRQTQLRQVGDGRNRVIRTIAPLLHSPTWQATVNYFIRVPRTVNVKIVTNSGERIRVSGMTGSVSVKNWNGEVLFENVTGPVSADTLNGNITFDLATKPTANLHFSSVNGVIRVNVPEDSAFKWEGTTVRGDFFSTLPVGGRFNGTKFLAAVNGAGTRVPTLSTMAMMKNVYLLRRGTRLEDAQSVRAVATQRMPASEVRRPATAFQQARVDGDFVFATLGNVNVGQVLGSARVETRAGEVQLGVVRGECEIISLGGPLTLGDVFGPINASTSAGDISIRAARQGATASTGGGTIRLFWSAGPVNLRSDGGDIVVGHAAGSVNAQTASGDVSVSFDPNLRTAAADLRTSQGNVTLNVRPTFAADLEVVVLTSNADAQPISSDFAGLTMQRETVGGRTRIRATGKVNGGGERVYLHAEEGGVNIRSTATSGITARIR